MYYCTYLQSVQLIPLEKLKFCDEAHVISKDLGKRKVLGVVGKRTFTRENTLNQPSASLTILTSLTDQVPIFADYRIASNTQWNFADFLLEACKAGYLKDGDHLVLDNAAVHCAADSFDVISAIVIAFGVKIIKLPTYSPELNPCELVFSQLKRHIRHNRSNENPSISLCCEVVNSLALIETSTLYNYYIKCVCPKVILPEFFQ